MDTFHLIIDDEMIRNIFQTNLKESVDLFSVKLVLYVFLLGLLPSYIIYKIELKVYKLKKTIVQKFMVLLLSFIFIILILTSFSNYYSSFFREHKPLRYYTNPTYWIYSIGKYINKTFYSSPIILKEIGNDAKIIRTSEKKNIVIMVVGEALRANRLSLNGYKKETNPLLKKEHIISLENFYSCGTSTAHSVPCMFSIYDRKDYSYKKGISTENVLDVLNKTKEVNILWRDNNSSSKGVTDRIGSENFKNPKNNTIYDIEGRDEGMLIGLDGYIENSKEKNILIILHQMGNHGPAYYKRYPSRFEKFTPVCKSNQLEDCTLTEISNAYDNATLYTDYFLSKVINFLKPYSKEFNTSMIYMADHGESLGENKIFLHGIPYFMAPNNQKHIPSIFWFDKNNKYRNINLDTKKRYSHDNLFSTLLGLFNVKTNVYEKSKDILNK